MNREKRGLSMINKTTITIGSIKMHVTNYEHPALKLIGVQEGCNGSPNVTTRTTIYKWTVQEGVPLGITFF